MQRHRIRLTVFRLMIAVAIAALAIEGELQRRRYLFCQRKADRSALVVLTHHRMADSHAKVSRLYIKLANDPRQSRRYNEESAAVFAKASRIELEKARLAANRGEAYRRAAINPWLAIPPDEPEPVGVNLTASRAQVQE
jgi:hypothetical protein